MLYREVPKNGDKLSILGYGCMRFPTRMGGIDEKLSELGYDGAIHREVQAPSTLTNHTRCEKLN